MKTLKAIALADLHCGSPRIDPFHFKACIEEYVIPRITHGVTHLFIAGDFFDLLINMNSIASTVALSVISELKQKCFESGTKLRVLRGTFTHDRNQPRHFLVTSPQYNSCVKLFDTMAIEYDEDTETSILYMPDNLPYANINEEVEKLLEKQSYNQVDLVIHHGYFKHMLPPGIPEPNGTLDVETFKKFYKGCVINGHVHVSSIYENVLSVGSFDRMAYGEEGPKGFYEITRNEEGLYSFKFIENKHAYLFWTVDLSHYGNNSEEAFKYFNDAWMIKFEPLKQFGQTVRLRIITDDPGIMDGCSQLVKERFPFVIVDRKTAAKREQILENVCMNLEELPSITPDNLESLLTPIIKKLHPSTTDEEIHQVLEECKGVKT